MTQKEKPPVGAGGLKISMDVKNMTVINLSGAVTSKGMIKSIEISRVGHVYLLEDVLRGMVKIGRSTDPAQRMSAIRCSSGVLGGREYFTHKVHDASNLELSMHNIFSDCRINGEWFKVDFEEVKLELIAITPKKLDETDYQKALEIAKKEADKNAKELVRMFHAPKQKQKPISEPSEQLDYVLLQLKMIQKYAECQENLYQSLKVDLPRFESIAEGFSDICKEIGSLAKGVENFRFEFCESLESMSFSESKLLKDILIKQLNRL